MSQYMKRIKYRGEISWARGFVERVKEIPDPMDLYHKIFSFEGMYRTV